MFARLSITWSAVACAQAATPAPEAIPASSVRPVRLERAPATPRVAPPAATLPVGYSLEVAAAAPLVTHPIAGCFDDRGRLFIGDAVGVNWKKADLEANPPNRVLLLEDTDHDGVFDRSTVFADRMTFPQGAQWLDGSLYVASPPGIWKLTDTDGDGVADRRELLASGFDYTGNAADVHGPFLHPDGRLYWCHGRKGYKAAGRKGRVLYEGRSSGIWSMRPDGTDLRWHSLLAGDNPVEVDFTPSGEVIGVQNLYYSQPRGDTIVHWLEGGVYERADLPQVIAGLPRTLATMPVMHNFGHVAVSGACFWRQYPETRGPDAPLQFLVTHFNTQRVVRMELTRAGASYRAVENEFLKLADPDIHLTDVIESPDGSLVVLNTGGWFRLGCPSSLMAKPDVLGSVLRVRRAATGAKEKVDGPWQRPYRPVSRALPDLLVGLDSTDAPTRLRTLAAVAEPPVRDEAVVRRLRAMMDEPLDAFLEHALLHAARQTGAVDSPRQLQGQASPRALRRLLTCLTPAASPPGAELRQVALAHLDSSDEALARTAQGILLAGTEADLGLTGLLRGWLEAREPSAARIDALGRLVGGFLKQPAVREILTVMLAHPHPAVSREALGVLAGQGGGLSSPDWLPHLARGLTAPDGPEPLLLDAIKKLRAPAFDAELQRIAADTARPTSLRLRALDAVQSLRTTEETFTFLTQVLTADASAAARIQAAVMLRGAKLTPAQVATLAPVFARLGPIELRELLPLVRRVPVADAANARAIAVALAANPSLITLQESVYRTEFSGHNPALFEQVILPARQEAESRLDAKKRRLGELAELAAARGDARAGRALFSAGKGTCIACHRVGELGRPIGPDLSHIGAIRTQRDLVESILFPSNTLARDYEAHVFELRDGRTLVGVVRSHTAEGLLVVDVAGQEHRLAHPAVVSDTVLTESLMPAGLDGALTEQELLDLVAWLRSLR